MVETPDELTALWLTDALASSGRLDDERIIDVKLTPIGTGQMSESLRVTLTYDRPSGLPATLVAKLPATSETSRATAKMLRSYENEVRFYQQLAADLPIRTPDVFFAEIDVESAGFVLLLEDLAPARAGDQLTGCSPELATTAVDELVKLHAPRWGDPRLASLEWLHRDSAASRAFLLALLPGLWDSFCSRYDGDLSLDVRRAGDELMANLDAYLSADTEPWSIVHGDYRLDNLLFDETPGGRRIAVVDWQTCTHGPALQDVAYFIGASLTPEARRPVEETLVRRYHERLLAADVSGYDWTRCWHDYRRGAFAGLIMAIAASNLVERTERGDRMFLTMAARHARHALDLDALGAIASESGHPRAAPGATVTTPPDYRNSGREGSTRPSQCRADPSLP
jgi:aminoglycoside/choline kinase family phosphotransferase